MGTGQAPVKRYNRQLRDLILTGVAKPSFLVSHEVPLVDAVEAYDKFDRRVDGYTKALLKTAEPTVSNPLKASTSGGVRSAEPIYNPIHAGGRADSARRHGALLRSRGRNPRAGDNPGTARKRPRPDRPASNTQT